MTRTEIDELIMLAKLGQPFYTRVTTGTKYKYWFEDGQWAFKYHFSARVHIMKFEKLCKYLADEILISESEYDSE